MRRTGLVAGHDTASTASSSSSRLVRGRTALKLSLSTKQQQQPQPSYKRNTGTSSSPPTPSPLSSSGSENNGGAAAPAKPLGRRSGVPADVPRVHLGTSASIHAAAGVLHAPAALPVSMNAAAPHHPPSAAVTEHVLSSTTSPPLFNTVPALPAHTAVGVSEGEAAATAKEVQRQQILGHANDLLAFCSIGNTVTSIRQCTSSFFVLLYQRLFDCTIAGIDRSPNTTEKRRHNVALVLEQLRQHPYPLESIEAEEVVKLNEDHISRLILVFVQVAEDMRRQQQQQQPAATPQPPSNVPPEEEDHRLARGAGNGGAAAYVPVGYTVAEVTPPLPAPAHTAHPYPQQQPSSSPPAPSSERVPPGYRHNTNPALHLTHHPPHQQHGMDDFYVAPAPPLNGAGMTLDPTLHSTAALQQPQQPPQHPRLYAGHTPSPPQVPAAHPYEEESPSSVSYYLDSSAIPTDELLEEWYRNLVYPAPHTPQGESSTFQNSGTGLDGGGGGHGGSDSGLCGWPSRSMDQEVPSVTSSSSVPPRGHAGDRQHTRGDAAAADEANRVGDTPSAKRPGKDGTHPGAGAADTAGEGKRTRRPTAGGGSPLRTQLEARDIVRRCQRLEEALDAQAERQRRSLMGKKAPTREPAAPDRSRVRTQHSRPAPKALVERHDVEKEARRDGDPHEASPQLKATPPPPPNGASATMEPTAQVPHEQPQPQAPPPPQQRQSAPAAISRPPPPHLTTASSSYRPAIPTYHRLVAEPPLTQEERDLLVHRPSHRSETAQRDRKIERLRAARYLGEMQQKLRQRMRHEYDAQMAHMRDSLKASMQSSKADKRELMRRVKDENERYRGAYATLMEAAANEAQVPARVMSRHTAQLADYYATSLQQSQAVCEALKRETDVRTREELLRYAEELSAWQQHFLL